MVSRSARKRQTQLTFTPLPSSSPAASPYHEQIRSRAASVKYSGSPAKRRKLEDAFEASIHDSEVKGIFPTPDASLDLTGRSQRAALTGANPRPKRQQRLDLNSSAAPPSASPPSVRAKAPTQQSSPSSSSFLPSRKADKSPRASRKGIRAPSPESSETTENSDGDMPPQTRNRAAVSITKPGNTRVGKKTRSSAPKASVAETTSSAEKRKVSDNFVNLGTQESEDDSDGLPLTPAFKKRKQKQQDLQTSSAMQVDSDSDSPPLRSSGVARRASRPVILSDDEGSDEEEMPRSTARRLQKIRKARDEGSGDDIAHEAPVDLAESEEDVIPTSSRRAERRLAQQREVDDDLLDLQSEGEGQVSNDDVIEVKPPPRQSPKKNARQLALEQLKRRRAGDRTAGPESEPAHEEDEDEHYAVEEVAEAHDVFDPNEDDEDFLTDGEEEPLGVPAGMPLEFTRFASMKAKELFGYVVEWMVQKKLNPAFSMQDEIYEVAFNKMDDEVKGLSSSKFMSAAWSPAFTFALRARPEIAMEPINRNSTEHFMRDKCDACNRTGHPATWQVQFNGRAYNKYSLEEIGGDDDSESDSDAETGNGRDTNRDAQGRQIPPETHVWYVGKHCMANAETAHALEHWRHHLYDWVVGWLDTTGHNSAAKIVERDSWSERKRRKEANHISDEMEARGKVKELYRDFKSSIDAARNAKQGRFGGNSP